MSKILFSLQPTDDLGLLAQALPIARELRNRGHEVIFSAGANAPNAVLKSEGFKNLCVDYLLHHIMLGDIRPINIIKLLLSRHVIKNINILKWYSAFRKQTQTAEVWNFDHFMYLMGMGHEQYTIGVIGASQRLLHKLRPDIVVNLWNPYMAIAAKIENIPLVSVIQADIHPQSKGFIWWREKPETIPSPVNTVNRILKDNQLPLLTAVSDLCAGDLTLVVGTPETEPLQVEPRPNYIGTLLLQNKKTSLPQNIRDLKGDKPLIWVYPGKLKYVKNSDSSFDSIIVLEACIRVLGKMNVKVVVSTGHHSIPQHLLPLPKNFIAVSFVPGTSMAEKSDMVIHHGGLGSTHTAWYTGTPSIVIPTFSERESNARRTVAVGTGEIVLPQVHKQTEKKYIDEEEFYKKISQVLNEKQYKEKASTLSERLKQYDGGIIASDSIEKFIQTIQKDERGDAAEWKNVS